MRRTKQDSDLTRQALLDAAIRIFARDGYAATKLDHIAAAAGVTRGAIAHHFGGKAEIFLALIADKQAVIADTVRAAIGEGGSPATTLRRFMIALLARIEEDEDYRLMNELMLFQRGGYPPEIAAALDTGTSYQDGIVKLVGHGIARGEFRPDADALAAARAILGLLCGAVVNWLLGPRDYSIAQAAPQIVDAFLCGLFASPASPNPKA